MKKIKMYTHNTSGFLITFCGLDGCGKSTIIERLCEEIKKWDGADVFLTKQPTPKMRRAPIFRTYMDKDDHSKYEYRALSVMAAADRIQHSNQVILPELKKGKLVISDRYFYSCLANLRARGYQKDHWIYELATQIPRPDLAFFLDVPVDIAIERVRNRPAEKDRYIDVDLQYALRDEYRKICKANNGILLSTEESIEDTFQKVLKYVEDLI